jgi:MFS family permease
LAVVAAVVAGACTFLSVYCTQPLLPLFQRLFAASEVEVSFTVGAVTLSVALVAPFVGMLAESIGRKRVIVPALFAMAIPMFFAATATNLRALIGWRLAQGVFVPGVIAVIIAYINEEFTDRRGFVMAAYVTGGVFGGFMGRFLTGIITERWNWRAAFVLLGLLDLLGAWAVLRWLPLAKSFVPGKNVSHSLREALGHLGNWRLLAICGMGFTVLFSLVGVFTYVNFYLAQPPYSLRPGALGSVFAVYLLGCVVTPLAGRFLDRRGFRQTALLALGMNLAGLAATLAHSLPLVIAGLALFSSGIFVAQSAATVQTGQVAERARSAAAGIYVTCYYIGGTAGSAAPGWFWHQGGWPACVGLFAAVSVLTVLFALAGKSRAT